MIDRDERRDLAWQSALALLLLLLFAPGLVAGGATFLYFSESTEQAIAWWQKLARAWHAGYLPLWDANTLSGHSFVGEIQTGVFYPVNWLWAALFGSADGMPRAAIEWLIVAHFAVATSGMFALLRRWGLDRLPSALGAVAFALLGPVAARSMAQSNIFFGLAWTPWALYAASAHFASGRVWSALAAGVVLGLQLVAGHNQPAFHAAVLVAIMGIAWLVPQRGLRGAFLPLVRAAALMLAGFVAVAGVQVVLTVEYAADALRWVGADAPLAPGKSLKYAIFAYRHIVEPQDLIAILDPWRVTPSDWNALYFGTLPLLLTGWLLASRDARAAVPAWRTHGPWLVAIAVFALLAMLGHYTFVAAILRKLPLVGSVRALARYAILLHFAGCALFAFAVHALARGAMLRAQPRWLYVLALLQVVWMIGTQDGLLSQTAALQLAFALLAWLVAAWRPRLALPAIAVALATHVLAYQPVFLRSIDGPHPSQRALARGPAIEFLEASYGRHRTQQHASAQLAENFADMHRLQSRHGYGASMYEPYHNFIATDWSLASRASDLLNVRWVLSIDELPLRPVLHDPASGLRVYERSAGFRACSCANSSTCPVPRSSRGSGWSSRPTATITCGFAWLHRAQERRSCPRSTIRAGARASTASRSRSRVRRSKTCRRCCAKCRSSPART